jgi:hypothetical protein
MKYSGETINLNARVPIELLKRLDVQAKSFDVTRSDLIRSILEPLFFTPEELYRRYDKERTISAWIRAGMPEPDPTAQFDQ